MAIKKDMLVEKYIEALESGTIPWEKGWTTTRLHNPITGTGLCTLPSEKSRDTG